MISLQHPTRQMPWAKDQANAPEREFRYVRHLDVPSFVANGWEALPALDGTHHGEYAVLMRRSGQV